MCQCYREWCHLFDSGLFAYSCPGHVTPGKIRFEVGVNAIGGCVTSCPTECICIFCVRTFKAGNFPLNSVSRSSKKRSKSLFYRPLPWGKALSYDKKLRKKFTAMSELSSKSNIIIIRIGSVSPQIRVFRNQKSHNAPSFALFPVKLPRFSPSNRLSRLPQNC